MNKNNNNNNKIRIAVYSNTSPQWGGSFQYARAFVKALSQLDNTKYDVRIWHDQHVEWESFVKNLKLKNYVIPSGLKNLIYKIAYRILQKILKKPYINLPYTLLNFTPDILISPQMGGVYHPQAFNISCIHDLMHRYESRFPEVGERREFAEREKMFIDLILNCEYVLVDSMVGKQQCLESYPLAKEEQIKVLPFVAYDEVTKCPPKQPNFTIPQKFLFYPAQFWLHKNHISLAQAMAQLKDKYPDIHLIATGYTTKNGYTPFYEECEKLGVSHCFTTPGYVTDTEIAWLYKHARAFVMPTFFGPTNIPPLEAMALGCPSAISDIYGMRESCGENVLYFDPASPETIAKTLEQLWTNDKLCEDLKQKGLAYSSTHNTNFFESTIYKLINSINIKNR